MRLIVALVPVAVAVILFAAHEAEKLEPVAVEPFACPVPPGPLVCHEAPGGVVCGCSLLVAPMAIPDGAAPGDACCALRVDGAVAAPVPEWWASAPQLVVSGAVQVNPGVSP